MDLSHFEVQPGDVLSFVERVLNYSSEYGKHTNRSYTISNICGEPQRYPSYGDFVTSMVLRTYGVWWKKAPMASLPFGESHKKVVSQDFLEVLFHNQLYPKEVRIFETFNPGCVVRIYACNRDLNDDFKTGEIKWALLWEGPPQSKECKSESRVFSPKLNKIDFPTNLLRIEFDCQYSEYYTELDGIALVGTKPSGKQDLKDRAIGFKIENTTMLLKQVSTVESVKKEDKPTPSAATNELVDYFSRLPNETISKILSYLDVKDLCRVACTNTHFLYLAYDPLFYKELDLQPCWVSLDDIALQSLQLRTQSLQKVSFSWTGAGGQISESVFHEFIFNCGATLEIIRLSCCRFITGETIELISNTTCKSLVELDLQACIHLNPTAFVPIKNLTRLRKLDLYRCNISEEALVEILKNCVEMEYLNLGATQVENMDNIAIQLGKTCHSLKAVDMWRSGLTGRGLVALCECKELLEIDIGWSQVLRELSAIDQLIKSCRKLRKLFLTTCRESDTILIESMAIHLPDLEQLDLLGSSCLSVDCIENLFKRCKKLVFIDISFCRNFTIEVVETLRKSYTRIEIKRSFQD